MEANGEGKLPEFEPQIPQLQQQTLLDIIEQVQFRIDDLGPINLYTQAVMHPTHQIDDLLDASVVFWEVDLDFGQRNSVIFVPIKEIDQIGELLAIGVLSLADLFDDDLGLIGDLVSTWIVTVVGVEMDAQVLELTR